MNPQQRIMKALKELCAMNQRVGQSIDNAKDIMCKADVFTMTDEELAEGLERLLRGDV